MAKSPFKTNPAKTVPRKSEEDVDWEKPSDEAVPAWPGELEEGSVLQGLVVNADATGGKQRLGTIDVDTGQETFRFYVNKPAQTVLKSLLARKGLDFVSIEGRTIAIRFDAWAGKGVNKYRLFSIGIVG